MPRNVHPGNLLYYYSMNSWNSTLEDNAEIEMTKRTTGGIGYGHAVGFVDKGCDRRSFML